MKRFPQKFTALCLSALLTASALAAPAAASHALGEDLDKNDTLLNDLTTLSTNVFWSTSKSDLRTENLITYTPNDSVTPQVIYGDTLGSRLTAAQAASVLEAQGLRVVAGINGDFYESSGQPVGLVIRDGRLVATDKGFHAVGFLADGSAVLGKPELTARADLGYETADAEGNPVPAEVALAGINKIRETAGGVYLYTYDFNEKHTTGTVLPGVDVVCSIVEGELTVGGTVKLRAEQILRDASATPVQPGQMVLTMSAQGDAAVAETLANVPIGAELTVSVTAADPVWNEVVNGVGALYSLLENGQIVPGLPDGAAPRTAVGQKADGTLVFYTIDGRRAGHSIGATLSQVAERMTELGCVTALGLDGGGSTTMTVTKPDANTSVTVNRPSEGGLRAVSNHLFLTASAEPSGELSHFYVTPESRYVLGGSKITVAASAVDTNYIPMTSDYDLDVSAGELEGNVLTTPRRTGEITVTASARGREGSAAVQVVETPDTITVKNGSAALSSLTVAPGDTVNLTAAATWNHLTLKADQDDFAWTLDGTAATVDETGTVTALTPGSGTLTVSAGERSAVIPVTVSTIPLASLEDFEDGAPILADGSYGTVLSAAANPADVRLGRSAARLDYTLGTNGDALALFALSIPAGYTQLNLWVRGDNSGNTLNLLTTGGGETGSETVVTPVCVLDFDQWRQVPVILPVIGSAVVGLSVSSEEPEKAPSGVVYLDQFTASYGGTVDEKAPSVTASADENGVITAVVSDEADGLLPLTSIRVYENGVDVTDRATYAAGGTLTYTLGFVPGEPHEAARITVTARDASGNIGRASVDVEAVDTPHRFTDTEDHWAAAQIDFLAYTGVTNGYDDGTFRPEENISRQQFATMLFRHLRLNEADYQSVELPFADLDKIAAYALPAVRALYALGIVGGIEEGGLLYFAPDAALSRAQAATMIGRSQEKGYPYVELAFTDADTVPAYAAEYIRTMTAQGVLNGYDDGSFRPNANITRGQMAKILYTAS